MELEDCFPELFCIKEDNKYKIFENIIYKSFETLEIVVNIVIPLINVTKCSLVISESLDQNIKSTFIRKWNGKHYRSCKWKYNGPYLKSELNSIIPLIEIFDNQNECLPYNSSLFESIDIIIGTFQKGNNASYVLVDPYKNF